MKKILVVFCAILMVFSCACVKEKNDLKVEDVKISENINVSENIEKKEDSSVETSYFSLTLPAEDTWDYEVKDNYVIFYNKKAKEAGYDGILFTVKNLAGNDFGMFSEDMVVAGTKDENLIIVEFPTEPQYNPKNKKIKKEFDVVLKEARKIGTEDSPMKIKD